MSSASIAVTSTAPATVATTDRPHRKMAKTVMGFVPAESPIYALHPATRLCIYLFMSFLPLLFQAPELEIALVLVSIAMYVGSGVPVRNLKMYAPMMVLVFCFISFSYLVFPTKNAGDLPVAVGPFMVYRGSLLRGFLVYTRVVALLFATIVYFSTNRERDILVALRTLHVPFVVSYFIGLVLRSAGTFLDDYHVVKEAEKARGLDMSKAPLLTKITHFPMYMVPLFTLAIRRSDDISVGLYAKGTVLIQKDKSTPRPDYMRTLYAAGTKDYALVALLVVVFVVCGIAAARGAFTLDSSVLAGFMGGVA